MATKALAVVERMAIKSIIQISEALQVAVEQNEKLASDNKDLEALRQVQIDTISHQGDQIKKALDEIYAWKTANAALQLNIDDSKRKKTKKKR